MNMDKLYVRECDKDRVINRKDPSGHKILYILNNLLIQPILIVHWSLVVIAMHINHMNQWSLSNNDDYMLASYLTYYYYYWFLFAHSQQIKWQKRSNINKLIINKQTKTKFCHLGSEVYMTIEWCHWWWRLQLKQQQQ